MTKHKKKKVIMPKLIIYKDKIIKVLEENATQYVGFDVLSETLFYITKSQDAIVLPEAVIKLIGCEKSRLRLADTISSDRTCTAKLMGLDIRSIFRCYKRHDMIPDDLIQDDGKTNTTMKVVNIKKLKVKMSCNKPKNNPSPTAKKNKKAA